MTEKIELLPCPFCGGEPIMQRGDPNGWFLHHSCGWEGFASEMHGYRCTSEQDAADAWNRRFTAAPASAADEENRRLRVVISACADALGNGAFVSTNASVEFMEKLPSEISAVRASFSAALAKASASADGDEISQIAMHLDCEPDADSILHTIREIQADLEIAKDAAPASAAPTPAQIARGFWKGDGLPVGYASGWNDACEAIAKDLEANP